VTRHVPEELGSEDWNTMVLHYLGLDHIGHKAGPRRFYFLQYVDP
jgi:ethanolamine phosphate transferase 2 subunit G